MKFCRRLLRKLLWVGKTVRGKQFWTLAKIVQKVVKESLYVMNDLDKIEDNKIPVAQHLIWILRFFEIKCWHLWNWSDPIQLQVLLKIEFHSLYEYDVILK